MKKLNNKFLVDVIEVFEDFLDEKGIRIENADRDLDNSDNSANIYGMDFAKLMEDLRGVCESHDVNVEDNWDD